MNYSKKSTSFYCFSPPVMIATFLIEMSLLVYTLFRYKPVLLTKLIASALLLLAVFQLAEYNVCEGGDGIGGTFSRLGFVAITLLPPIGLHMISLLSRRVPKALVGLGYASGLGLSGIFGFAPWAFQSHACGGNYAIFQLADNLGGIYFAYYYGLLIIGIGYALRSAVKATQKIREALLLQVTGYLILLIPTGIVNAMHPETIQGIPSIMCGFAVLYAFVMVFGIAPTAIKRRIP